LAHLSPKESELDEAGAAELSGWPTGGACVDDCEGSFCDHTAHINSATAAEERERDVYREADSLFPVLTLLASFSHSGGQQVGCKLTPNTSTSLKVSATGVWVNYSSRRCDVTY